MNDRCPDSPFTFFQDAAAGKPEAFSALVDISLAAGVAGRVTQSESLAAAETYAHFAAAIGGVEEGQQLCRLLLAGAHVARDEGDLPAAAAYEEQACLLLRDRADGGDDEAAELLNTLRPGMIWEPQFADVEASWLATRQTFAEMARGDMDAFSRTIDSLLLAEGPNQLRGLVTAEHLARVGAAHGTPAMQGKLAGILWLRAVYEARAGDPDYAATVQAECVSILLRLSDAGDTTVHPHLQMIADTLAPSVFAMVVQHMPGFLMFRAVEGAA